MHVNLSAAALICPDKGGILGVQITGDQRQKIETILNATFLQPAQSPEYAKAKAEYDKKYANWKERLDKGESIPDPPQAPAASGIPADFVLIIDQAKIGGPAGKLKSQEHVIFRIYGSAAARKFIVEKCGIPL